MAVTNEQIQQWFQSNPNASDKDIYNAMQTFKVDPTQLTTAMNFDPNAVQQRYQAQQTAAAPQGLSALVQNVNTNQVQQTANTQGLAALAQNQNNGFAGTGENFTVDKRPIDHSYVSLSEYQNARGQPRTEFQNLNYDAAGGSRLKTPAGEMYFSPYAQQPSKDQLTWLMAQPSQASLNSMNPMDRKNALESWQKSKPGYADPTNYNTFEQYIGDANPRYTVGKNPSDDAQNRANFYGMTLENYNNALSGDMTKPMGQYQQVYGNRLLSPVEQIAAQTARSAGLGNPSPDAVALAKKYPEIFARASKEWANYLSRTFPKIR
jgi:hypothetical protein